MSNYRLTPDAQSDLVDIRRYTLEQWGEAQSVKYLSGLRETIRLLAESPSMGKQRREVGTGVQSFPHVSHVIYYKIHEDLLLVFGVLHKSMVPIKHLDERNII